MKTATITGIVHSYRLLNNSTNGNTRYEITLATENGIITGRTASDSTAGYTFGYWLKGKEVTATYHTTPTGRNIFHRITKA